MPKISENPVRPPDYDAIALDYDARYRRSRAGGIHQLVEERMAAAAPGPWLEVGCGTGQWLLNPVPDILSMGLDQSWNMLAQAAAKLEGVPLMQADAVYLPIKTESLAALATIHAIHHFSNQDQFLQESLRVLRPGAGLLLVGLDAHDPALQWYIYDFFEGTEEQDQARFPDHQLLLARMQELGFSRVERGLARQIEEEIVGRQVLDQPFLQRRGCSQMALLSDEAYAAGMDRIQARLRLEPDTVFQSSVRLEYLWGVK